MTGAVTFFKLASQLSGFEQIGYVKNLVQSSRQCADLSVLSTIATVVGALKINRANRELYRLLRETVLAEVSNGRISIEQFIDLVLLELPERYELWLQLTEHLLPAYVTKKELSATADGSGGEVGSPVEGTVVPERQQALLVLGLTVFPASPELLQLRALQYHMDHQESSNDNGDGNGRCAAFYASAAVVVADMWQSSPALLREGSAAMEVILSVTNNNRSSGKKGAGSREDATEPVGCEPVLGAHSRESFQHTHRRISSLYEDSDRWTHIGSLWRHSTEGIVGDVAGDAPGSSVVTAYTDSEPRTSLHLPSLQVGCSDHTRCPLPGFLIADALPSVSTHFVTQAYALSMLQDSSVALLYSSHTLEHLSHALPPPQPQCISSTTPPPLGQPGTERCGSELHETLREWRRVLATGGRLLVSVPDMEALTGYFVHPDTTSAEKAVLVAVLFGGQHDVHDFHKSGLFYALLEVLLSNAGFCQIERVPGFGLFDDTSGKVLTPGRPLSVNVRAVAC